MRSVYTSIIQNYYTREEKARRIIKRIKLAVANVNVNFAHRVLSIFLLTAATIQGCVKSRSLSTRH
jgi:hypothetical protein